MLRKWKARPDTIYSCIRRIAYALCAPYIVCRRIDVFGKVPKRSIPSSLRTRLVSTTSLPEWRRLVPPLAGRVELATLERWYTRKGIVGSPPACPVEDGTADLPPAENPTREVRVSDGNLGVRPLEPQASQALCRMRGKRGTAASSAQRRKDSVHSFRDPLDGGAHRGGR